MNCSQPRVELAVYPGSFDPVTLGHLEIIRRARSLFSRLQVLVCHNPDKPGWLDVSTRIRLIKESAGGPGVEVARLDRGLLADYCQEIGARVLVKGLRNSIDFALESSQAWYNANLGQLETVFLFSSPGMSLISSSAVRKIAQMGGDISGYIPEEALRLLSR